MSAWIVGTALGLYAVALFAVGWTAQRRGHRSQRAGSGITAALAIGVYCTSWTFYGAVGTAARTGWDYLPIYLGPIIAFTVGLGIIRRTVALGKGHGATSLSDLLSRRFGRSSRLAALVTLTAAVVSIPYIALQLVAVASTFAAVTDNTGAQSPAVIIAVATLLGAFGLVFGTRNRDVTARNPGLVSAMAFDSLFKLAAFAAVASVGIVVVVSLDFTAAQSMPSGPVAADRFVVLTLLSACATLCLPRQFHMAVVEASSERQIARAAPFLVGYLALFAVLVPPITAAGRAATPDASPDLFVLALPAALGSPLLELVAFTGGFAAASGIVIVAGVALSTMVASDLVVPALARLGDQGAFSRVLLIRRLSLCGLVAMAAAFAIAASGTDELAAFGIVAFAGAAQFAPLLLAALFMPRASEAGAISGLLAGAVAWALFVLGPSLFAGSVLDASAVTAALLPFTSDAFTGGTMLALITNAAVLAGVSLLSPSGLTGREDAARFAAISPARAADRTVQAGDLRDLLARIIGEEETADLFAAYPSTSDREPASSGLLAASEGKLSGVLGNASANILISRLLTSGRVEAGDVMILMGDASRELRFGQELLSTTLENLAQGVSVINAEGKLVAWNRAYQELFGFPEGLLEVGRPLADLVRHNLPGLDDAAVGRRLDHLAQGRPHTHETTLRDGRIVRLQGRPVPGGGYVTSFSDVTEYREAQAALKESERATRFYTDNVPFPIGFSDATEILRFHNKAFAEMIGCPGTDLTGRALRTVFGVQYPLREIAIRAVLAGHARRFVLAPEEIGGRTTWQVSYVPQFGRDGEVTGFFGFYQDISKRRAAQAALEEANRNLENRVDQRTLQLRRANDELDRAREEAEAANRSKTRFLAAASHDVLQPLNAARLFASSLEDDLAGHPEAAETAKKISAAVVSADTLLRSLLNLSKLEAGGVDPKRADLPLGPYLRGIADEFQPLALEKGLDLRVVSSSLTTRTDAGLLRSALQNLVSNALRYTDRGGVVIGTRRRPGGQVAIEVADTGRGISDDELPSIFGEFTRLQRDRDIDGAGLGLATVKRVADLLGHRIEVSSRPGRGTVFRILVPRHRAASPGVTAPAPARGGLTGARVLCVDNDRAVLDALKQRFERWGALAEAFSGVDDVRDAYRNGAALPDLMILDYQLDGDSTGLDVFEFLTREKGAKCPAIVVTASRSAKTEDAIAEKGLPTLPKPVEPASLRALSVSLLTHRSG